MDGYSVTEAASVLGVPTERVWELLARGVLSGHPEGETGMRVFLQPRPGPPVADPSRDRPSNGNGGTPEPTAELSPFRELLTEFRNLTERYGQALLALGEARGEVASLRSRVDVLEARMDLRLPTSVPPSAWPYAPMPAPRSMSAVDEADAVRDDFAEEVAAPEEAPRRRRRSGRPDLTEIAEALARANDPSPPELREVRPASAEGPSPAVEAEPPAGVAAEPEPVVLEPQPVAVQPEAVAAEPGPVAAEPEPVALEPEVIAVEPEAAFEPQPVAAEAEPVAAEPEAVAAEAEPITGEAEAVDVEEQTRDDDAQPTVAAAEPEVAKAEIAKPEEPVATGDDAESAVAAISADESLQADGDWPAAAPTIDVADLEPVAAVEAAPVGDVAEPVADAIEAAYDDVEPMTAGAEPEAPVVEPVTIDVADLQPDASVEGEVIEPVADAIGEAVEMEPPTLEAEPTESPFVTDAEAAVAEAGEQPVHVEDDAGFVDTAPVETIEAPFEAAEAAAAEPADDSPYRATLEEPDWLSEEEMGMPSEPPADDRWGSTESPAGTGGASWSLWDVEPSAAPEVQPPVAPESAIQEGPSAEPPPAPTQGSTPTQATPAPAAHADEEPVLWLGGSNEAAASTTQADDAGTDEGDDAAAEMEVAATGWQSADREGAASTRRGWRATELPGSQELEDALAALRRMASGRSGNAEPELGAADDQVRTPAAQTGPESSEAGPAQRAYARLRRILPR